MENPEDRVEDGGASAPRPKPSDDGRRDRRAAALRANLQRRKAQSRGRATLDRNGEAQAEPPRD